MLVTSPSVFSPSLLLRRLATTKSCISWLGASVVYSVVPFSIHQRWLCTGAIRGQCIVRSDMWSEMALVTVMWIHLHFGRTSSARSIMSWYCNSFPALTDPSHEKVSPANGTVSWLFVLWHIFVMFGCGHLWCVILIPPPLMPWYNEHALLRLLVPVMIPSLSLVHPYPPWVIGASLALQKVTLIFSPPHYILYWTLVGGGGMHIIQNVDVFCLQGEHHDRGSSWKTGSCPLSSPPIKAWPLWPTQWCWRSQGPNGHRHSSLVWPSLAPL